MSVLANGVRGEVLVSLGGQTRCLCLTLGALAQLETAFGLNAWSDLGERLVRPSSVDLKIVLRALLDGGGEAEVDLDRIGVAEAAQAVAEGLAAISS
jgi:hypothetical protein